MSHASLLIPSASLLCLEIPPQVYSDSTQIHPLQDHNFDIAIFREFSCSLLLLTSSIHVYKVANLFPKKI